MSLPDKLERLARPITVPGLIRYVALFSSAAFIVGLAFPNTRELLPLVPAAVLSGEVWRLLTFAFIPSSFSLFWIFALMFLFYIGDALEEGMGATRLTVFYLLGWVASVAASFIFGSVGTPLYLNLSLLLAFATLFPNMQISLYLIFPVKVKWLALFALAGSLAVAGFSGNLPTFFLCLGNYFLFFGLDMIRNFKTNREIAQRRHEFREKTKPETSFLHQCKICGRTEQSDPELEFRVAADGEDYCAEHLPQRPMSP